jgi:hypothetical protein
MNGWGCPPIVSCRLSRGTQYLIAFLFSPPIYLAKILEPIFSLPVCQVQVLGWTNIRQFQIFWIQPGLGRLSTESFSQCRKLPPPFPHDWKAGTRCAGLVLRHPAIGPGCTASILQWGIDLRGPSPDPISPPRSLVSSHTLCPQPNSPGAVMCTSSSLSLSSHPINSSLLLIPLPPILSTRSLQIMTLSLLVGTCSQTEGHIFRQAYDEPGPK